MSIALDLRRGWCPDMLRPMQTSDGLLVRLHPRSSRLSASQAMAVADGANRFGNGLLDISSRGNIQIRGATPSSHPALADALIAAGLMDGVRAEGPFRLTTISPLAGIDPADHVDALAIAEQIEQIGRSINGLHPKFSVLVDGGGTINLDEIDADIRLVVVSETCIAVAIARSTGKEWLGALARSDVPQTIGAILTRAARLNQARLRDLDRLQLTQLLEGLRLGPVEWPPTRARASRAGYLVAENLTAYLLALPYGRCRADALSKAASWCEQFGRGEIRLSPFKAIVIPHVADESCVELTPLAREAGFIVDERDARLSISACVGMEGCTRGSTPTHADADRLAGAIDSFQPRFSVHVSGCAKGCAHPAATDLTLVGDAGAYQLVLGGTARHKPTSHRGIDAIVDDLPNIMVGPDIIGTFETTST